MIEEDCFIGHQVMIQMVDVPPTAAELEGNLHTNDRALRAKRLTQDSTLDSIDDAEDQIDHETLERSHMHKHRLLNTVEMTMERTQNEDETGDVRIRYVQRKRRGRCRRCNKKTSHYCAKCKPEKTPDNPNQARRYWLCHPDTGRQCWKSHLRGTFFGTRIRHLWDCAAQDPVMRPETKEIEDSSKEEDSD